jgi:hypothetical protein
MPKFKGKINLYISSDVRKIFEDFDKLRPNNLSFSTFVAHAMNEYLRKNNGDRKRLVTDENVEANYLHLLAPMGDWQREIHGLDVENFKRVHTRIVQLGNLINIEVNKRL